jgi:hypothetical protein
MVIREHDPTQDSAPLSAAKEKLAMTSAEARATHPHPTNTLPTGKPHFLVVDIMHSINNDSEVMVVF